MRSPRPAVWLALLALAVCVQRSRTYDEPFERDIMTYAVVGHELVLGNKLYSDVLDNKPPAIYATFGLAEGLTGYGPAEVYLVNVVFSILAMAGLYAGAAQAHGASGGLVAAALWLLFSYDLNLQANQPNTELCLNALLSVAFALAFGPPRSSRAWAAGLVLALASLFKPVALVMVPLWASVLGLQHARRGGRLPPALSRAAALGVPAAMAWAALLGYFWLDDRYEIFTTTMFAFNRDYAGSFGHNLAAALSPSRVWPHALRLALPLLLLAIVGLALGLVKDGRAQLPVLSYFAGALVMIALPGHWWAHYYQLDLPPLVLGAASGLAALGGLSHPWGTRARAAVLVGVFAFGLTAHLRQLALDGDAASMRKYGRRFIAVRESARRVSALLREGETVYMYGIEPGIYFYSRRRPIAQALWINHLTGPLRVPLRHTLRRQLREVRPELIVADTRYSLEWIPPGLVLWIEQEYERLPAEPALAPFQLLVRRDSALRARLTRGGTPAGSL